MLKHLQISFAWLAMLGLISSPIPLLAQDAAPSLSEEQLDTLLAPIALYPDPLLAQILPASTVPGDVVIAARYVAAKKDVNKIDEQPWEESVKALARYPEVLQMMDEKLDWTTDLGHAFIAQPEDVFNSVQRLRAKAQEFGNLKSSPQQVVAVEKEIITIMPADPQVIYVPQYQPQVVYVQQPATVVAPLITFGAGLALGVWIHNEVNWHNRNVYYHNYGWNSHYHGSGGYYGGGGGNYHGGNGNTINRGGNNININGDVNIGKGNGNNGSVWKPQNKPRPTPYGSGNGSNGAANGNRPNGGNTGNRPNTGNGNGVGNGNSSGRPSQLPANGNNSPANGNRPSGGNNGNRPNTGNGQQGKPSQLPANGTNRPSGNGAQQRPATRPTQPTNRPGSQPNGGFSREGTKPRPDTSNRPARANNPGGGGGGGGGRFQR